MKKLAVLTALAMVAGAVSADVVWEDATGGLNSSQNLSGGTISAADGIGGRDGVALIDLSGATADWLNINSGTIDFTAYQGWDVTFSYDYYVPTATPANGQVLYDTFAEADIGGGWNPIAGIAKDTWITKTQTGTINVDAGSNSVLINLFAQSGTPHPAGALMYLDNITVEVIPEPATIGLIGLFGGGMLFIRRRFMI